MCASDFVNEISTASDIRPKKPRRFEEKGGGFIAATRSLRELAIANFSTKLARLNMAMLAANGDTHVKRMQQWRDEGLEAEFIQDITRGPGEPRSKTAREMVLYLCDGSPACRLVLQEVLAAKAIEKLDKQKYKQHQKVMPVEATVPCAWYLEQTLRAALLDARVMHAGLSNQAKAELCDLFNDPNSTLKILIIMYDVGAVGLNLHLACNRVVGLAIPRSEGQNGQAAGRVNRVSSTLLFV
jgi:SNF2 family DNA or RNA helicase